MGLVTRRGYKTNAHNFDGDDAGLCRACCGGTSIGSAEIMRMLWLYKIRGKRCAYQNPAVSRLAVIAARVWINRPFPASPGYAA